MANKVMQLNDILGVITDTQEKVAETTLVNSDTEKVASVQAAEPVVAPAAFTPVPEGELNKIAEEVLQAEEEAVVKEAHMYGAAVADGFMTRIASYQGAADEISPPQVADMHAQQESQYTEKQAEDAYSAGVALVEKTAATLAYNAGYSDVISAAEAEQEKLAAEANAQPARLQFAESLLAAAPTEAVATEKTAEELHIEGYIATMEKTASMLKEAGNIEAVEALEKTAFDQGYEDAMVKIAGSAFDQGYNDFSVMLQRG